MASLLILLGLCAAANAALERPYVGYQVLEITPNSKSASESLREWELTIDGLDFWSHHKNGPAVVMVPPELLGWVKKDASSLGMTVNLIKDDVQSGVDIENAMLAYKKKAYDRNNFNTLDDIMAELQNLRANHCPRGFTCQVNTIGSSYEGRNIEVFKISKSGSGRRSYWIDSTIHAREWLATSTNMRILDHMLKDYGSDSGVTQLLDNYDWYFLPVNNPDGYLYSWTNNRYWRKNRQRYSSCYGVDLNRNFDFRFGLEGVSHSPCSDLYCGPRGGSEPETEAVQDELNRLGSELLGMVTLHTYGNMFMHPWGNTVNHAGWTCDRTDDYEDLYAVAGAAATAIGATYGTSWAYGTSCEVIYEVTGATDDYAKGVSGIKYAFNPELRGSDFVVSPSQIGPAAEELFNGIVAMANAIRQKEGL